ncbi:hypothetical protein EJ573_16210 [Paenibacillus polymyxa]|nr:hypothetical protein FGY93_06900 [Paenibacillus polymyxa]RTZ33347.1 hypothetical protein EJ573_16210 [Paenibacillus polymyxa]
MATRVSYPLEIKMKAIEMRLAGVPVKEVMEQLVIRNKTQLKTWMRVSKGEVHHLGQPVGKQYSYGKGLQKLVTDITYYNSIRVQAKLNNQSPVDFRRLAA